MRLKTFNGAPLPQHLNFDEVALISVSECGSFAVTNSAQEPTGTASTLKWRHVRVGDARLRTGWSQPYFPQSGRKLGDEDNSSLPDIEQTSTFLSLESTRNETTMEFDEPSTDPFLEHSLVFHDTLLSSQVVGDANADETISSSSFLTTSFGTTESETKSPGQTNARTLILQVPPNMALTQLGSLPTPQHLRSIYPQTPTPNFLCVLMSPPERREVFVRKGGYNMDLYELIVADDTSSGFKVTFWLRPARASKNGQSNAQQSLLQTLENVRVGDILLLRNIALTCFRDTIHGQSLNPSITRARTTIDVLMNSTGVLVGNLDGLPEAVVQTFQRVKKWARIHVARTDGHSRQRRSRVLGRDISGKRKHADSTDGDSLPSDTLIE